MEGLTRSSGVLLHVTSLPSGRLDDDAYRFVELGRGRVDLRAVFAALTDIQYDGWAVVELDESAAPKESGAISRRYLTETLGLTI